MNIQVDPSIKPLITDLEKTKIGKFLITSKFERLSVQKKFHTDWNDALRIAKESRSSFMVGMDYKGYDAMNTLKILSNQMITNDKARLNNLLFHTLYNYIEWSAEKIELDEIFLDLEIIKFNPEMLKELKTTWKTKNETLLCKEDAAPSKGENKKNEYRLKIESKRNEWINNLSEAKVELTIKELRSFALEVNQDDLTEEIINISSRWFRLQNNIMQHIMNASEEQIEFNKINKALFKIINTLQRRI